MFFATVVNFLSIVSSILLIGAGAWIISTASNHVELFELSIGITLVRTAGISRAVFKYLDRFLSHRYTFRKLTRIRLEIFTRAAEIFPTHENFLHELMVEADTRKDFFSRVFQPIAASLILALISSLILQTPLILSAFLISIILPWIFFESVSNSRYKDDLINFSTGSEEIKISGAEKIFVSKLNSSAVEIFSNRDLLADLLTKIFCDVVFCILILEFDEKIELAVGSLILLALFESFSILPDSIRTFRQIKIYSERKKSIETFSTSVTLDPIKIDHLNFSYDDRIWIFKDFSLAINRGQKIAIIGESGSGKTTLFYLLLGILKPTSGTISVAGKISATGNFVFSKSIRENFSMLVPNLSDELILKSLSIAGLNLDLDMFLGDNGSNISGGEYKRLLIALSIGKIFDGADILLLDEPTAGLDRKKADEVIDSIYKHFPHITILIITHDLPLSNKCDKIVQIRKF